MGFDKPKRREQILVQQSADKLILFNLEDGQYFALDNEVSTRIWELSDGTHTVSQMAEVITKEFDAPPDVIKADILELLEELAKEKLLDET